MKAAETQLSRVLAVLTEREFPLCRGLEGRIDAYYQLEELQCLEDSEVSVIQFQRHLSPLLDELRFDLQQNTLSDVLHAALRCLSYFMHHRSLAAAFPEDHFAFFLGELVRRLFSTSDQNTYKLCLWCLTMQNFEAERHKFLPGTIEGLVQAIVNPFKSRSIELQALKGLHLLLVKYPDQVGANHIVLNIFVRPIASRLSSGETSIRTQARLVLEEASKHLAKWSQETVKMIQDCTEEYLLPVMKVHLDRGCLKDAVCLWTLALTLLRSKFTADLESMNHILYVPEKCMKDQDPAVRLMAMRAWSGIINILRTCEYWLFNKAIVGLLIWPIRVCLEKERLLNVMDAAFVSWRTLVTVAVQDFNDFCIAQQHCGKEGKQQFLPEWKFWFGELVLNPILILAVERKCATRSASIEVNLEHFVRFAKRIWEPEIRISSNKKISPSLSENSSSTVSSVEMTVGLKRRKDALQLTSKVEDSCDHIRITSDLFGVAFLLEDIFGGILKLIRTSRESSGELYKKCAYDLATATWKGMSQRIFSNIKHEGTLQSSKLGLRLVRMSLDFSFGILSISSSVTASPSGSVQNGDDTGGITNEVAVASVEVGLSWQLQLLASLMSHNKFPEDFQVILLHPKCKVFDYITQRMSYLEKVYVQCATMLKKWNDSESELQIDFSNKSNGLPYLMINLLFEYAIFVDRNRNNEIGNKSMLLNLEIILKTLAGSRKLECPLESRALNTVIRFGEESIRAGYESVHYDNYMGRKASMLDKLVSVCMTLMERTNENQQNDSLLLDLQKFPENPGVAKPGIDKMSNVVSVSEDQSAGVVQETECISASFETSTSSPCLLSPENATIPNSSPVKNRPDATATKNRQQRRSDGITSLKDATASQQIVREKDTENAKLLKVEMLQTQSVECQSIPSTVTVESSLHQDPSMSDCIYPDLVGCNIGIAALYRHFPMGFRPFFSFYKVKTIGDLSALSVKKVRTFGLKEPVSTVRRALEEFEGRKERIKSLISSPFRSRSCSTSTTPEISTPSPRKLAKRPLFPGIKDIAPTVLKRSEHKRAKRSLVLDMREGKEEQASGGTCQKTKVADRVTFCLPSGNTDGTRITRPGDDSQDQLKFSEKADSMENVQVKVDSYTLKLLQHLKRAVYYMDKLVTEEESISSEEGSICTNLATVDGVITNYHDAHELVSQLASQLQIAVEASSKRCSKLLDKCGPAYM